MPKPTSAVQVKNFFDLSEWKKWSSPSKVNSDSIYLSSFNHVETAVGLVY